MSKYKESIGLLTLYFWPRTVVAWIAFFIYVFLTFIFVQEMFRDLKAYIDIGQWDEYPAKIEKINHKESLVGIKYSYTIDNLNYVGEYIGVNLRKYTNLSVNQMESIKDIYKNSRVILIRVEPGNPSKSTYVDSYEDVYLIPLILIFPLSLSIMYILMLSEKLRVLRS